MYSIDVIVNLLRLVYECSCPFLTIKPLYNRNGEPVALSEYIIHFWRSKFKNKRTAQELATLNGLLSSAQDFVGQIQEDALRDTIQDLIKFGALCQVNVDIGGYEVEKLLLMPLGLQLWRRLDSGPLLNQRQISFQALQQVLTRNLPVEILRAERGAWIHHHQGRLGLQPKSSPFTPEMVCFGMYLLLNGAIAPDRALHLVRTSNKNYRWDETLVAGLNVVAGSLFNKDSLFKVPSLQDVLQRRSELVSHVGSTFVWEQPPRGGTDELYWWEIGDDRQDFSKLDHIVRTLIHRAQKLSASEELPPIEDQLKTLFEFFRLRVDYQLPTFEMSELFPKKPEPEFDYTLRDSIDRVLAGLAKES